jgi:hypothetical protein
MGISPTFTVAFRQTVKKPRTVPDDIASRATRVMTLSGKKRTGKVANDPEVSKGNSRFSIGGLLGSPLPATTLSFSQRFLLEQSGYRIRTCAFSGRSILAKLPTERSAFNRANRIKEKIGCL